MFVRGGHLSFEYIFVGICLYNTVFSPVYYQVPDFIIRLLSENDIGSSLTGYCKSVRFIIIE